MHRNCVSCVRKSYILSNVNATHPPRTSAPNAPHPHHLSAPLPSTRSAAAYVARPARTAPPVALTRTSTPSGEWPPVARATQTRPHRLRCRCQCRPPAAGKRRPAGVRPSHRCFRRRADIGLRRSATSVASVRPVCPPPAA